MKDLLRIASLLDNSGQYKLSDKLFKIAQENSNPPTQPETSVTLESNSPESFITNLTNFGKQNKLRTIKDAMDKYADADATYNGQLIRDNPLLRMYRKQFGFIDFNNEPEFLVDNLQLLFNNAAVWANKTRNNDPEAVQFGNVNSNKQLQADQGIYQRFQLMNSNTPENFVKSLFLFAEQNQIKNLVQAFDAYAIAGASYNGNSIKRDPILRELYMRVRNTPRFIPGEELVNEIKMLSNPQGTMNNQAASMRAQMPAGQAYETFSQVINNSKSLQELERYKKEIFYYDTNKFDQNDKNALFSLIKEKETEITSNNQQETADNYNEFISLVQQEPLAGLETLRTEIQNNQYLTEQQKTQLSNMIDTRITNRR